jgi:predicted nucleic acid-binding protein
MGAFNLRKSDQLIEDAMIAATARVQQLSIATRNEKDFIHLQVEIFNPFNNESVENQTLIVAS